MLQKKFVLLWGPTFCGGPCSAEHAEQWPLALTSALSSQWLLSEIWACASTPSCQCGRMSRVVHTCFCHLRRIHAICRQLGRDVTARIVTALFLSCLDYSRCGTWQLLWLAGLPAHTLALFKSPECHGMTVLDLKPHDHVTPALKVLHWLPVTERISTGYAWWSTSCFLDTRWCTSQTYWHQLPMYMLDLHCVLRRLATSSCHWHVDESATGLSLSPHREHGTGCRHSWSYGPVSVYLYLCLSVTVNILLKRVNLCLAILVAQTTLHDSWWTLVFWIQRSFVKFHRGNSRGGAPNAGGVVIITQAVSWYSF